MYEIYLIRIQNILNLRYNQMSQLGRICIDICVIAQNLSFSSFHRRFMDSNRRIKTLVMVLFPTKVVGHRYFLLALSTFVYLSPIHVMSVTAHKGNIS